VECLHLDARAYACTVYVFLGDPLALIDFMRALDAKNLNSGEYLVIAVQDETFEPNRQKKYFKKCKTVCNNNGLCTWISRLTYLRSEIRHVVLLEFHSKEL